MSTNSLLHFVVVCYCCLSPYFYSATFSDLLSSFFTALALFFRFFWLLWLLPIVCPILFAIAPLTDAINYPKKKKAKKFKLLSFCCHSVYAKSTGSVAGVSSSRFQCSVLSQSGCPAIRHRQRLCLKVIISKNVICQIVPSSLASSLFFHSSAALFVFSCRHLLHCLNLRSTCVFCFNSSWTESEWERVRRSSKKHL